MIGNTRLYEAVKALASVEGDVRSRVVVAMRILEKMHPTELDRYPGIKTR